MTQSIFLDFSLPNAPTWFYLSAILAIALFFKFNRILSLRNWDLITLFLLAPGLLILKQEYLRAAPGQPPSARGLWWGYLWLLVGSGYFFIRCLIDLAIVRRPALEPNLNRSGLAWLMLTMFVCLGNVAIREPAGTDAQVGKGSAVVEEVQKRAAEVVAQTAGEPIDGRGTYFWVQRGGAAVCHLAVVAALILIGRRHFGDLSAGMSMRQ